MTKNNLIIFTSLSENKQRYNTTFKLNSVKGIDFIKSQPPVYAVFVLVGTRDERNFHLRALSALAQIVQDANFDRDWLRAKNIEELRDIILVSKRHR